MRCKFSFWGATTATKTITVGSTEYWNEQDAKPSNKPPVQTSTNLDRHFTYYTVMKDFPDMVLDNSKWSRFAKAPEELREEIKKAILNRNIYIRDRDRIQKQLKLAKAEQDHAEIQKLQGQLRHRNIMVPAITEELRVAFFFGPSATSFDRNNPYGNRPKFRTDVETAEFMTEVTIGKTKRSTQLNDYVTANVSQRELIMYAPNMSNTGQRSAEKRGFCVVRNIDQLFVAVERFTYG